jgi:Protein of unknown function (DUF2934)
MSESAADIIVARITGEAWFGKDTTRRAYPTRVEVARRAYSLYEARGCGDGRDVEDWLLAERQLQRGLR